MFVSLKKYLDSAGRANPDMVRVASLFLQGIQLHACQTDELEYGRFRDDLDRMLKSVGAAATSGDVILATGAAIQAMSDYNQQIARALRGQTVELQSIVKMLGDSLQTVMGGGERQVGRLQAIELQIQRTSQLDDLRVLKSRLEDCLGDLRETIATEREHTAKVQETIHAGIEKGNAALASPSTALDPSTGLPGRAAAEAALEAAWAERRKCFAAVFTVNRVETINDRFGHAAGDRILMLFSQHLSQNLSAADTVYRWRGPAFLVLLDRNVAADAVRAEVARIGSTRLEENVQVGSRMVFLPVSANSSVLPLHECHSFEEVLQKLVALESAVK